MKRISYIILSFSVFSVFATHAENTATANPGQNNTEVKVFSIEEELSLLDKDFQQLEKQLQISINEQVALPSPLNETKKEVAATLETEVQARPKDAVFYQQEEIFDDDIALTDDLDEDLLTDDTDAFFEEMLSDQHSEINNAEAALSPISVPNEPSAEIAPVIMFESQEESLLNEEPAVIAVNNDKDLQPAISAAATKTVKEAVAIEVNLHQVSFG